MIWLFTLLCWSHVNPGILITYFALNPFWFSKHLCRVCCSVVGCFVYCVFLLILALPRGAFSSFLIGIISPGRRELDALCTMIVSLDPGFMRCLILICTFLSIDVP